VETRAIKYKGDVVGRAFHDLGNWDSIAAFCQKYRQVEVYFAVATRDGGGTKNHIVEIPAVFADIDFKNISKKQARKLLWEFEVRPSAVVESGGGYHAYWKLREPATKDDITAIETLNKRLAAYFKIPDDATDASRVLRLPDTQNNKLATPRPVKVVHHENFTYSIEALLDLASLSCEPSQASTIYNNKDCTIYKGDKTSGTTAGQGGTQRDNIPNVNFSEGHHDNSLFSIAFHLAKGGMSPDNVLETIEFLADKLDPDNETKRWARAKIKSAFDRLQRGETSLANEIRAWVRDTSGTFSGTEVDKDLNIGTKRDKENRKKILQRLVTERLIERIKGQSNLFRTVELECERIDFLEAPTEPLDIRWPLGIDDYFKTYRRNIIVVAGDQDAGKTAYLLNFAKLNMYKYKVRYFSSEMGNTEMRSRLELFPDMTLQDWSALDARERSDNFADVIHPDDINIVDYMEMHDQFYLISQKLKDIHDKLKNGIAIVALQKSPGADLGRGGSFSLEKPRLYLSMRSDYPGGVIKIVKCKNWRTNTNPNGLEKHFKLYSGCQFSESTEWERGT